LGLNDVGRGIGGILPTGRYAGDQPSRIRLEPETGKVDAKRIGQCLDLLAIASSAKTASTMTEYLALRITLAFSRRAWGV
jgi:hypothetical protein